MSASRQQADIFNSLLALSFPVWNKKFPVLIAGNSSKEVPVSMGFSKRGGASQHSQPKSLILKDFLSLARPSNFPRIPARFRPLRFGFKRQRHFFGEFGRDRTRKSLGRHLGVNLQYGGDRSQMLRITLLIADETPAACAVRSSRSGFRARGASASWR
jgi:hypothetical protein